MSKKRNQKGFTLVEVLVAMMITLITAVGFFGYIYNAIAQRAALKKNNIAYNIAVDVADRLAKLPKDHVLIAPKTGNLKYIGYDASYNLKKCSGSTPSGNITVDSNGKTEYSDPFGGGSIFLYDNNTGIFGSGVTLNTAANANIDHPNIKTDAAYVSTINSVVNPIRRDENGVTYYVVWSVAYMPCNSTDKAMIFITVYWIDPEPSGNSVSNVNTNISSGKAVIKSISITSDKAYKVEQ